MIQTIKSLFKRNDLHSALQNAVQQLDLQRTTLDKVMAIIEFSPEGIILDANDMFVFATGYSRPELIGHHHRMLVTPEYAASGDYAAFWKKLASGQFDKGQYKRINKAGEDVWLEASYNPVVNASGKVEKIIKYATVITACKIQEFDHQGQLDALDKVLGVIEFTLNGHILRVNDNFLQLTGYSREEVLGRHHRMFMESKEGASPAYHAFWQKLGRGEFDSGIYKRVGKDGREIWLQATYNPIYDNEGKPFKVVKYATDITTQKLKDADVAGQLQAINKIQAVIQFDLTGHILDANDNFIQAVGYTKEEIVGKHHSMFVLDDEKHSAGYAQFWHDLGHGRAKSGVFERVGKHGKKIWLQADYNPIFDAEGKPFKVVKYATDITAEHIKDIDNAGQISAINRALGTIEFTLDGHIIKANQNFCDVVGYPLSEIADQHHRMFVPEETKRSLEYQQFWQKLARGEFIRGVFERVGKQGNKIWLQASYNPIIDQKGRTVKVVKYAIDITAQKLAENGLRLAVAEMQQLLEAAQQGDMTARIDLSDKSDQILSLSKGINALMEMLSGILLQVQAASETISAAADEISSGNSDLSMRTEKQANNLQDTAASMSELAATVKQNAENAMQANEFATAATLVAERGGKAVSEVVATMSSINDSAKKIADITSVIDSIAFQTNILALNASVEAARAGEQGKGFAVVADEVRNLAQRSASAAKEIKVLIADSVNKTNEGSRLAEGAGSTMNEIVHSVKKVSHIISEISTASAEQTGGIDQVNLAVGSMDETTQQNAALVEEAAAAAESLVDQAGQLTQVVSGFKLSSPKVKEVKPFSFTQKNGTY